MSGALICGETMEDEQPLDFLAINGGNNHSKVAAKCAPTYSPGSALQAV